MYTMKQLDDFYYRIKKLKNGIEEADIRYCDEDGLPKHLLNTQEQCLLEFVLELDKENYQ